MHINCASKAEAHSQFKEESLKDHINVASKSIVGVESLNCLTCSDAGVVLSLGQLCDPMSMDCRKRFGSLD